MMVLWMNSAIFIVHYNMMVLIIYGWINVVVKYHKYWFYMVLWWKKHHSPSLNQPIVTGYRTYIYKPDMLVTDLLLMVHAGSNFKQKAKQSPPMAPLQPIPWEMCWFLKYTTSCPASNLWIASSGLSCSIIVSWNFDTFHGIGWAWGVSNSV